MRKKYSKEELLALKQLMEKHGSISYVNNFNIEEEFFEITGIKRKSGPLYMASWRLKKGIYNV